MDQKEFLSIIETCQESYDLSYVDILAIIKSHICEEEKKALAEGFKAKTFVDFTTRK